MWRSSHFHDISIISQIIEDNEKIVTINEGMIKNGDKNHDKTKYDNIENALTYVKSIYKHLFFVKLVKKFYVFQSDANSLLD